MKRKLTQGVNIRLKEEETRMVEIARDVLVPVGHEGPGPSAETHVMVMQVLEASRRFEKFLEECC
jgi:hypothetical protein